MVDILSFEPLARCPKIIRGMVQERKRRIRDEDGADDSDRAFVRLCCSDDMRSVWDRLIDEVPSDGDLTAIALTLSRKTTDEERLEYERKTDPERLKWLLATRGTLTRLIDLLNQAPPMLDTTPLRGSPEGLVREFVSMAQGLWYRSTGTDHLEVPNSALKDARIFSPLFQNYWGLPTWGLREIAARVLRDLEPGVLGTMTVRKPRDAKGVRAAYIQRATFYLEETYSVRLTNEEVATVVRVVFDESSTSPAIASKYRFRSNRVRMLGAIQHSDE